MTYCAGQYQEPQKSLVAALLWGAEQAQKRTLIRENMYYTNRRNNVRSTNSVDPGDCLLDMDSILQKL